MKKIMLVTVGMLATLAYGFDNSTYIPETGTVPRDSAGFDNVKTQVQTNFNEMYHALPADLQNRLQSAKATIENIRLKPPTEALAYVLSERERFDMFMRTTVSQMQVTDAVKVQIDNSRKEIYQRINERMSELRQRRLIRH
jgi:hypothetical protein